MNSIFCGIEKLSLVDFDGYVACTLFTGGCNYRCPFCHNSPLIHHQPTIDLNEIFDYLNKRKKMIDAVVITGGEPTIHKELPDIIKLIKNLGFKIKLDTNGTNPKMLKELIDKKLIDYVAMDIKTSSNCYSLVTGVVNPFLDNIKEMKELVNGAKKLFLQKFVLRDTCLNQDLHEVDINTAKEYKVLLEEVVEKVILRGY